MVDRLALVSCRSPFLDDSKVYVPLGNLYLKSFVNQELPDVDVVLLDDNYGDLSILDGVDTVGISVMTPQRKEADVLARRIKVEHSDIDIVVGGPHVKHYFSDVVGNKDFDYVVPGDGEKALVSILRGEAERVVLGGMSKADVFSQPRPDRTSQNARTIINNYSYFLNGRESTTLMTGRGCPELCTFCEDARTSIRWSSQDSIEAQLDDIVSLGKGGVYIFDDLFAIAMKKVKPIAEALSNRDLLFRCNGQARYFTKHGEAFAELLAENGCYEIAFGHESGSQLILDNINKRTTVEENYRSVDYAKKHGIKVKSFILLGLPGENYHTLEMTENFIRDSGVDDFQCAIYYPYKGTQIRDSIDRGESIDLEFLGEGLGAYGQKGGLTEGVVRTRGLSRDELVDFRDYLVRAYHPESHDHFFDTHLEGGKENE